MNILFYTPSFRPGLNVGVIDNPGQAYIYGSSNELS